MGYEGASGWHPPGVTGPTGPTGPSGTYNVYGSFQSVTTQIAPAINTPVAMYCEVTEFASGIVVNNNLSGKKSRFTVSETGIYNIQFSAQVLRTSGGTQESLDIWLRSNEINIPASNTKITLKDNQVFFAVAWNFFVKLNAGEYCELMYAVSDIRIELVTEPENLIVPHPAIPSIIVTMNKIGI